MAKPAPKNDDVKVEHKQHGCPIDQRRDAHTHTQDDWRKVVDAADPWPGAVTGVVRRLLGRLFACSCNCAGCVLGKGHCNSVLCGGG